MENPTNHHTRVSVAVLAHNEFGEFLIGKRTGTRCSGYWGHPGGSLDFGESIEECAHRELLEEAGVLLKNPAIVGITSSILDDQHWIIIFVGGQVDGTPKNCEPDKCAGWEWATWNNLPSPLLLSIEHLIEKYGIEHLQKNVPLVPKTESINLELKK